MERRKEHEWHETSLVSLYLLLVSVMPMSYLREPAMRGKTLQTDTNQSGSDRIISPVHLSDLDRLALWIIQG